MSAAQNQREVATERAYTTVPFRVHHKVQRDPRATIRYALLAQVIFTWTDDQGELRVERGCTRDISTRGAYVLASGCPPSGAFVVMNILLPMLAEGARALRVETTGRVQRVDVSEQDGLSCGFSVCNERTTLCAA